MLIIILGSKLITLKINKMCTKTRKIFKKINLFVHLDMQ